MICIVPHCQTTTPMAVVRRDRKDDQGNTIYGLRTWERDEFVPQAGDVFQERLYCIKYLEKKTNKTWEQFLKKPAPATDATYGTVRYVAPDEQDFKREEKVIALLQAKFEEWGNNGYLPNIPILDGNETSRLTRERGWQYWHQLFNPRQLLLNGLFYEISNNLSTRNVEKILALLGINRIADFNSKLSIWFYLGDKGEKYLC